MGSTNTTQHNLKHINTDTSPQSSSDDIQTKDTVSESSDSVSNDDKSVSKPYLNIKQNGTHMKFGEYKNRKIILKCISKQNSRGRKLFINERSILSSINHPNIIKYFGCCKDEYHYFILLDRGYCDLADFRMKYIMNENHIKSIIFGVLNALNYLHSLNICHRDIKPENIVLKKNNYYHPILIDFGESLIVKNINKNKMVGTAHYLSPERILNNIITDIELKSSDIWALGVTTFELINGNHCFNGKNYKDIYKIIINNTNIWKKKLITTKIVKNFIIKCLIFDYKMRWNVEQCLNHVWFKNC